MTRKRRVRRRSMIRFIPDNLIAENRLPTQAERRPLALSSTCGVIWNTSRASDRCAARAGRSNIGIFIKQKDD